MKLKNIKSIQIKWIFISIISLILIIDFFSFISTSNNSNNFPINNNNIIIVLTGGPNRIEKGYELLEKNYGKKLFISGVNPIVKETDLKNIINPNNILSKNLLFSCCVFYEKKSYDTKTNAIESLKWLNKNNYKEILLVTSAEHMPRSLFEFKKNAPNIEIQTWVVRNKPTKFLIDLKNKKQIFIEYVKLILTRIRYLFKGY